jgi:HK97 gp10 family phage protein
VIKIGVDLEGMDAVVRAFQNMRPKLRRAVNREVVGAALRIQGGAKRRTPVRTGRLRNSIGAADTEALLQGLNGASRLSADTTEAVVGTNVEYAPFVEFGTRRMAARPFLVPAFEEERPGFELRLAAALRGELG